MSGRETNPWNTDRGNQSHWENITPPAGEAGPSRDVLQRRGDYGVPEFNSPGREEGFGAQTQEASEMNPRVSDRRRGRKMGESSIPGVTTEMLKAKGAYEEAKRQGKAALE